MLKNGYRELTTFSVGSKFGRFYDNYMALRLYSLIKMQYFLEFHINSTITLTASKRGFFTRINDVVIKILRHFDSLIVDISN